MGTREGANEQEKDSAGREDEEDGNNWLVGQSELEEVEMDDSLDLAAWPPPGRKIRERKGSRYQLSQI